MSESERERIGGARERENWGSEYMLPRGVCVCME